MRFIIALSIILSALSAHAGQVRIRWTHEHRAVDGSAITPTGFRLFWAPQGTVPNQVILTGPINPWQSVNGVYHYSRLFTQDAWTPGQTFCFQMSALAGELESGRSNQVCRVMPSNPTTPVIIDISNP